MAAGWDDEDAPAEGRKIYKHWGAITSWCSLNCSGALLIRSGPLLALVVAPDGALPGIISMLVSTRDQRGIRRRSTDIRGRLADIWADERRLIQPGRTVMIRATPHDSPCATLSAWLP